MNASHPKPSWSWKEKEIEEWHMHPACHPLNSWEKPHWDFSCKTYCYFGLICQWVSYFFSSRNLSLWQVSYLKLLQYNVRENLGCYLFDPYQGLSKRQWVWALLFLLLLSLIMTIWIRLRCARPLHLVQLNTGGGGWDHSALGSAKKDFWFTFYESVTLRKNSTEQ